MLSTLSSLSLSPSRLHHLPSPFPLPLLPVHLLAVFYRLASHVHPPTLPPMGSQGMATVSHILDAAKRCIMAGFLSGMLQKFCSFRPILLSFITYVLLSYSVRLHCANVHTPLPLLSYLYDTEHQDKVFTSIRCWSIPTGQLGYRSWLSSYSGPVSAPSSHRRGVLALSGDSTMSRPANWWTK